MVLMMKDFPVLLCWISWWSHNGDANILSSSIFTPLVLDACSISATAVLIIPFNISFRKKLCLRCKVLLEACTHSKRLYWSNAVTLGTLGMIMSKVASSSKTARRSFNLCGKKGVAGLDRGANEIPGEWSPCPSHAAGMQADLSEAACKQAAMM